MILSRMLRYCAGVPKRFMQTLTSTLDPVQDKAMNEMCILINENDQATGFATKRDCHLIRNNDLPLHRAFSVLLFNSNNELLLQKRSPTKITFPGHVSNTCCSHPLYDIESEREVENAIGVKLAAQRRLTVELGIAPEKIDINSMHYLTRIHYKSFGDGVWGEHEIDYILVIQKDVDLDANPDEVCDVRYVSQKQLKQLVRDSRTLVTPWFRYLVESDLITNWWDNLHQLNKFTEVNKIHKITNIL